MIHFYSYNVKDEHGDMNRDRYQDREQGAETKTDTGGIDRAGQGRDGDRGGDGLGHIVVASNSTFPSDVGSQTEARTVGPCFLMAQLQWRHSKILTFCAAA